MEVMPFYLMKVPNTGLGISYCRFKFNFKLFLGHIPKATAAWYTDKIINVLRNQRKLEMFPAF